ncbi:MAG: chemotaxis response regulator protein-glutamate methylesterase [Rickettsiales bacterium]
MKDISVLIIDDSAFIRQMLSEMLSEDPEINVVGTAFDPFDGREKIKKLNPDVITLDVEMPKMDGLTFLEKIMSLRPMPVVMISTLTGKGTDTAIRALQIGAVECIGKPEQKTPQALQEFAAELCLAVKKAAGAKMGIKNYSNKAIKRPSIPINLKRVVSAHAPKLIAIGASTGGVETLSDILPHLPDNLPPIVITQHMPPVFTDSFARRISASCAFPVYEAADGMELKRGMACIAAGGKQLMIIEKYGKFICKVTDDPPVNNHKPSVDVMFDSVREILGDAVLAIILTGMGKDGAEGLLRLRQAGAFTIGQNEASCVVYGMPRAAYEIGAVEKVVSLTDIPDAIIGRCFS